MEIARYSNHSCPQIGTEFRMNGELLLHPRTKKLVQVATANLPHAVVLSGQTGSGKGKLAKYISTTFLDINESQLGTEPRILQITPDSDTIGIEQSRSIQKHLKLKQVGKLDRRVVVIYNSSKLTLEAQSALLKLLEEPPDNVLFILTTEEVTQLLPTIASRVQHIPVLPLTQNQVEEYYLKQKIDQDKSQQDFLISAGLADFITDTDLMKARREEINFAKTWLKSSTYDRLLINSQISNDNIRGFISSLLFLYKNGLETSSKTNKTSKVIKKWHSGGKMLVSTIKNLNSHPNQKLLLTNLAIQL